MFDTMLSTSAAPAATDVDHVREQLAAVDGSGDTEAGQIALIAALERLKGAVAAAQARVTDSLARSRAAREAERGVPAAKRGQA